MKVFYCFFLKKTHETYWKSIFNLNYLRTSLGFCLIHFAKSGAKNEHQEGALQTPKPPGLLPFLHLGDNANLSYICAGSNGRFQFFAWSVLPKLNCIQVPLVTMLNHTIYAATQPKPPRSDVLGGRVLHIMPLCT